MDSTGGAAGQFPLLYEQGDLRLMHMLEERQVISNTQDFSQRHAFYCTNHSRGHPAFNTAPVGLSSLHF